MDSSTIETTTSLPTHGASAPHLEEVREVQAAIVRFEAAPDELPARFAEAFEVTARAIETAGATFAGEPFGRYLSFGPRIVVEAGFPFEGQVAPTGQVDVSTLPGGRVATTTHVGPYETIGTAWTAAQTWIADQGLTVAGPGWESYLTDPFEPGPPVTKLVWPVR